MPRLFRHLLVSSVCLFVTVQVHAAAPKPNVLVIADMEGTMGIADPALLYDSAAHDLYGRALLTGEVNAALHGLLQAGAGTILFSDSHFRGANVTRDQLPADLVWLAPHALEAAQAEVDAIFERYHPQALVMLAYHVASGGHGFLPHTFVSRDRVRINGREVGEVAMLAALAGSYGVPVVALSGDAGTCEEAQAWGMGAKCAASKELLPDGRLALQPLDRAEQQVREAAAAGWAARATIAPLTLAGSETWEMELRNPLQPARALPGGVSRTGGRLQWQATSFRTGFRTYFAVLHALGH